MDAALMGLLVVSFATFCTVHVAVAVALGARGPWWRGVLALLVFPLAPYWALREKLWKRSLAWGGALLAYLAMQAAARLMRG